MELFRYRNLTLASFSFLVALFVSYYFNNVVRIATLALAGVAILLLLLVFALSRDKHCLDAIIRYTPTAIFIILAMVLSLIFFDKSKIEKYCDDEPHELTALVLDTHYDSSYLKSYEIRALEIDGEELDERLTMTLYSVVPIREGSTIKSTGYISRLKSSENFFDSAEYFRSKGITTAFESDSFTVLDIQEMDLASFLEAVNQALDMRFSKVDDEDTHAMLSALFLGNKEYLSKATQRDFSRIGLSHVLALSGMHIAIIVTLLGYALHPLPISKVWKEIILILATLTFVAITGFSESALRAGIMVCLTYTLFFFGNRLSLTTALFYSVTIICIITPFSIFSLSLQLSFLAMLGCMFSAKIIHSSHRLRILKSKPLRYVVYTLSTSTVISIFTLPLISVSFGQVSLISPISNLLLGPLFSVLILLSPVYLIVADIPYVSLFVAWLSKGITHACSSLGGAMSNLDNVTLPIINTAQFVGIILISVFIVCMLLLRKKLSSYLKTGCALGMLVFIGGSVFLFCQREANVYASAYNFKDSDIMCVEDSGEITVIDVTTTSVSASAYASSAASSLGYYEIDNYVITDLSATTDMFFDSLSDRIIIRNLYLRIPCNEDEKYTCQLIEDVAKKKGISVMPLEKAIEMERSTIRFAESSYVPSSARRAIALRVECQDAVFTYLSSGAFELCDGFVDNAASISDVIAFGAYGPKYKTPYSYDTPYLDHALFLGESKDHAALDFYKKIKDLQTEKIRFCLTP